MEARGLILGIQGIQGLYFSSPQLIWLIPVLLIAGLVYLRARGGSKLLMASRLAIFSLIVLAAANPYFVETHTIRTSSPSITILDDQTGSMGVFDPDVAARLSQVLRDSQIRPFSGDVTPLGDRIIQNSLPGETLVLVSDGQNNQGRPLDEALSLARASNTTVFAIDLQPIASDSSVEIQGTNTAVLGGDYPFTVVVRSAGSNQGTGTLSVYADDALIYTDSITANGTSSIKISHTFLSTGTHVLRASIDIAPDRMSVNNNYQKALYVVPKPDVLLVSDVPSPLSTEMEDLYNLSIAPTLPSDIRGYKAIVLDDQRYRENLRQLNDYVREGGGLVVAGGPSSYEFGGYLNSSIESILPVRSAPSTFEGGKTAVLILDISFSLMGTQTKDGTTLLDYEKALAIELLKSPDLQDYDVGLVVFGTKAYDVVDPIPLARGRSVLEERIASLAPTGTENTYLDSGLMLARDMLNSTGSKGELIVFSDGNLWNYEDVFTNSVGIIREMNTTTRLFQVQAIPGKTGRFDEMAAQTGAEFVSFVYPTSLTTKMEAPPEQKPAEKKPSSGFPVSVVNENHYITSDLQLNASITGFNDVTPKAGSERLVAMSDGKPVLTVWRYGLGRVAALSTDDGNTWAGQLYGAPNSKVISATINWAVGDPRPQMNRIEAEDGWLGTPLMVTISSNARPSIDGAAVEKVGDQSYVATITPDQVGIYYIGDFGIAVNYPLEYRDIGFNPDLPRLIMANGGKVFTEDEARSSLIAEASRLSQRTVQERVSRRDILLLVALTIFIAEVIGRRLQEIRRRGRSRRGAP